MNSPCSFPRVDPSQTFHHSMTKSVKVEVMQAEPQVRLGTCKYSENYVTLFRAVRGTPVNLPCVDYFSTCTGVAIFVQGDYWPRLLHDTLPWHFSSVVLFS